MAKLLESVVPGLLGEGVFDAFTIDGVGGFVVVDGQLGFLVAPRRVVARSARLCVGRATVLGGRVVSLASALGERSGNRFVLGYEFE